MSEPKKENPKNQKEGRFKRALIAAKNYLPLNLSSEKPEEEISPAKPEPIQVPKLFKTQPCKLSVRLVGEIVPDSMTGNESNGSFQRMKDSNIVLLTFDDGDKPRSLKDFAYIPFTPVYSGIVFELSWDRLLFQDTLQDQDQDQDRDQEGYQSHLKVYMAREEYIDQLSLNEKQNPLASIDTRIVLPGNRIQIIAPDEEFANKKIEKIEFQLDSIGKKGLLRYVESVMLYYVDI